MIQGGNALPRRGGRAPAFLCACGLAVGIAAAGLLGRRCPAIQPVLPWSGLFLLAAAGVNGLGGRTAQRRHAPPERRTAVEPHASIARRVPLARHAPFARDLLLLFVLAVAGASLYQVRHIAADPNDVSTLVGAGSVTLRARIIEVRDAGVRGSSVVAAPESAVVLSRGPEARPVSGLVWVTLPPGADAPGRGSIALLEGEVRRPRGRRNPDAFDFSFYLRNRCVRSLLRTRRVETVVEARGAGRISSWIECALTSRVRGDVGATLLAMLLGRSRGLPPEILARFRRSGTVHVLAVSGLHVGFVSLMAYVLLRSIRVPKRASRLLVLPFIAAFVMIIGARASVLRAGVMASSLVAASVTERRVDPLNALGAAATVLLISRPGSLFDLGFQLSFAAVLGILILHAPLRDLITRAVPFRSAAVRRVTEAIALSVSAQIGVAPVLVCAFGELSVVSPLANLAVVPLAGGAVASGVATAASATACPPLATLFAACAWVSTRLLSAVARLASSPAWASVSIPSRLWPAVLSASAGLALLVRACSRRGRRLAWSSLACAAALATLLSVAGPGRDRSRVIFFDVGQGDAALLELPGRRFVLVDAGPGPGTAIPEPGKYSPRDAGTGVIVPHLRRGGIRRLAAIVITHGHSDHFGGAASVLREVATNRLIVPLGARDNADLASIALEAERAGVRVLEVAWGDTFRVGAHTFTILGPERSGRRPEVSENDMSVVLRGASEGVRLLLTGDIEARAEDAILRSGSEITADILKVAHHGSNTSTGRNFLAAAAPSAAIVSVGEGNRFGHPDAAVLELLSAAGAAVFRTDLDGAVVATLDGGTITIATVASGRSATVSTRTDVRPKGPPRPSSRAAYR